uniref:Uncharacterized protein n=1 Tax=Triticum urartu TaxID=4572 RepID=A0A8R7PRH2_TRIUA
MYPDPSCSTRRLPAIAATSPSPSPSTPKYSMHSPTVPRHVRPPRRITTAAAAPPRPSPPAPFKAEAGDGASAAAAARARRNATPAASSFAIWLLVVERSGGAG